MSVVAEFVLFVFIGSKEVTRIAINDVVVFCVCVCLILQLLG